MRRLQIAHQEEGRKEGRKRGKEGKEGRKGKERNENKEEQKKRKEHKKEKRKERTRKEKKTNKEKRKEKRRKSKKQKEERKKEKEGRKEASRKGIRGAAGEVNPWTDSSRILLDSVLLQSEVPALLQQLGCTEAVFFFFLTCLPYQNDPVDPFSCASLKLTWQWKNTVVIGRLVSFSKRTSSGDTLASGSVSLPSIGAFLETFQGPPIVFCFDRVTPTLVVQVLARCCSSRRPGAIETISCTPHGP